MDNIPTVAQGVAEFNKLTTQYGTTLISYNWDAGHSYSLFESENEGGTALSILRSEMSILSTAEMDEFEDVLDEWLSNNDECPPCEPGGGCGCSDITDIDTVRDYRQAHDKVYGIGKFKLYHENLNDILLKADLDKIVDDRLGA